MHNNPIILAYFIGVIFEVFMLTACQQRSDTACECHLSAAAVNQTLLLLHSYNQRLLQINVLFCNLYLWSKQSVS